MIVHAIPVEDAILAKMAAIQKWKEGGEVEVMLRLIVESEASDSELEAAIWHSIETEIRGFEGIEEEEVYSIRVVWRREEKDHA